MLSSTTTLATQSERSLDSTNISVSHLAVFLSKLLKMINILFLICFFQAPTYLACSGIHHCVKVHPIESTFYCSKELNTTFKRVFAIAGSS